MNKKLILDYSKWRCGGTPVNENTKNQLGEGLTAMRNDEGFCCCLGLFAPQINPEITKGDLIGADDPSEVGKECGILTVPRSYPDEDQPPFDNSDIAISAIYINDNGATTPEEKIEKLKILFREVGYEIEVINKP